MTVNIINYDCPCGHKKSDVQCKIFNGETTTIQIKCLGCKHNHYLKEDDERCSRFFKDKE